MIKKVGDRIRYLRAAEGMTQANMAEELGMTTSAYSKIERAEINIPLNRVYQIAEVLEVPVISFFEEEQPYLVKEPPGPKYGYASISELEDLKNLIRNLQMQVEKLKDSLERQAYIKRTARSKTNKTT